MGSGSTARADVGVMMLFWGILVSEQRSCEARGRDRGPLPGPFLTAHGQHLGKQGKKKGFLWVFFWKQRTIYVLVVLGTRKRVATLGI